MSYELRFHTKALKEWKGLDSGVREQLKKRLAERLEEPHVASAKLSGATNRYKIKLRKAGVRLVYEVDDSVVTVTVLAVGKRERSKVYVKAAARRVR